MNPMLRHSLLVFSAIIIAGAMVAGAIVWGINRVVDTARDTRAPRVATERSAPSPSPAVNIGDVSLDGVPFVGDPAAPAVMAYWYDYQCPFCREVELKIMPQLMNDYVKTGKLRIYFKDFQFLGPDSFAAGLASRAVWEVAPKKFYDWHSAMFENQDAENGGWGNAEDIVALTETIPGIDAAKVEELMSTRADEYQRALEADLREASGMGINGTPGTIIGSQLIAGAAPYTQFRGAIDQVLAGP
jgi:protein-disulfide isomerase